MAQAKTLNQAEIDQVLQYIPTKRRYSIRNRTMLLTSFYSGMRVCNVQNDDGTIRGEIRLSSSRTKGNVGRVVFVNDKLRTEFASYVHIYKVQDRTQPLFYTEKRSDFTANTLTQ
jgi:integrase/recombinase XerD